MPDYRFGKQHRVRKKRDFDRVYRRRCAASNRRILVFGCENDLPYARLGLSVSRKVGNTVRRNRWKRLLREAFRLSRDSIPTGIDYVIIPRPEWEPDLHTLLRDLPWLARRVNKRLKSTRPLPVKGAEDSSSSEASG